MALGRINEVATLTGFSYKKMYGHFARRKNSSCNNKVAVRWGVPLYIDANLLARAAWYTILACLALNSITKVIHE